ncbi:MAG: cytochrome ubiquinol oxidase subunit I [Acidobacteriota bacterium]|nr:cytochrome ubiquinol oxidase subunit I [Blastocatellia bacterium]MDW8412436.1 cytochrome ubiquinol oxidase subunit I [Acidobacteriota bacterium]
MNYPFWDVPLIGSGWVIGTIAIFHVVISHFAIGGGFYLPIAERKALAEGRADWMEILRNHSRFFLILTGVFGAVSGVGIWFSIGLAHPEATSTLIHNFVFAWAIEWVFFVVELTAAAVYYYTWGKLDSRTHLKVGWVYALSSWMSLVIINGILTFMLTPGERWLSVAGSGNEASAFWSAFFNPTYWPSLFLRTLVMISLAGIFALFTAAAIDGYERPQLKTEIVRWSSRWLVPSFVLMPFFFAWYLFSVPESQRQLLQLGISTIGQGTFTQVTRAALVSVMTSATIVAIVYFVAYKQARSFSRGWAWTILLLAVAATAATEQAREMLRKPYVIGNHMYSNGIRTSEVASFNEAGYLTNSIWLREDERRSLQDGGSRLAAGELIFRGQCASCHTRDGYRSMRRLLQGRNRQAIENLLGVLHRSEANSTYRFMPPLVGSKQEIEALADYLENMVTEPVRTAGL